MGLKAQIHRAMTFSALHPGRQSPQEARRQKRC